MGFFHVDRKNIKKVPKPGTRLPIETLRRLECKGCPLNKSKLKNPKILPYGSKKPFLYIIGEHPGRSEDRVGEHFAGSTGRYLDLKLPREWDFEKDLRINNCIRCGTGDKEPSAVQLLCCAPSIERDISESKPWGIVGFGNISLEKFIKVNGIQMWRGRRIPINVNGHICWFFPLVSPGYLIKSQKINRKGKVIESDWDKVFKRDLESIEDFYQKYSDNFKAELYFESEKNYYENIEWVEGDGGKKQLHKVFDWMEEIADLDLFAIDIEATSLRPYYENSRILTVAIGTYDKTYCFPIDHPKAWGIRTKVMHKKFKHFLLNSGKKICHNLNMEQEWFLYNYGDEIIRGTEWTDTMAQAYVLDTRKGMLSLGKLVLQYMGFNVKVLSNLDMTNMINEPLRKVLPYNGLDTKYTFKLHEVQQERLELKENKSLLPLVEKHIRTSGTIVRMQKEGLIPNTWEVVRHQRRLNGLIKPILSEIQKLPEIKKYKKLTKKEFNPRSNTDDVLFVFKNILMRKEIEVDKKGKNGEIKKGYSVDESVLKKIPKSKTKLPSLLLKMRGYEKLKSTYVDSIAGYTYFDGLIHPNFNDKFTNTGRLSCIDPNGQNFPKRKHKNIRSVITANRVMEALYGDRIKQYKLVSADYGQIEARVIAMASQDDKFVTALWNDLDIHMEWAEYFMEADSTWIERVAKKMELDINNVEEKVLMKAVRFTAKNSWVFAKFFGAANYTCAKYLDIKESIAEELGELFWKEFAGVKEWQDDLQSFYKKYGYVESLTGRRRYAPVSFNEIINTPVQGCASDIVVDAMNRCSDKGYQTCLNVHDDLLFRFLKETYKKDIKSIANIMCFPKFNFINIPISIEIEVGSDWYDLKEYKIFESNKMNR